MFANDLVGKTPVSLKTHRFTLCADKYLVGDCSITFGPLKFVHAVKMHVFHLQWCFTIISIVVLEWMCWSTEPTSSWVLSVYTILACLYINLFVHLYCSHVNSNLMFKGWDMWTWGFVIWMSCQPLRSTKLLTSIVSKVADILIITVRRIQEDISSKPFRAVMFLVGNFLFFRDFSTSKAVIKTLAQVTFEKSLDLMHHNAQVKDQASEKLSDFSSARAIQEPAYSSDKMAAYHYY